MERSMLDMKVLDDDSLDIQYNVNDLPVYYRKEEIYDFIDHKTIPHWNDGMETIYIQKGCMDITMHGKKHRLNEKDICIITAGCIHYFEAVNDQNCIYYCCVMDESIFSRNERILNNYIVPLFHSHAPSFDIIPSYSKYNESMVDLFRKIKDLLEEKPIAYDLKVISLFYEYISILYEYIDSSLFHLDVEVNQYDENMRLMLSYIHANYMNTITIQDLCEIGFLSRNQVYEVFHAYMNETPADYILKHRLGIGRNYLVNTTLSIADIARACGFSHQSHFTNHFMKQYNMTPSQFRKVNKYENKK